MLNLTNQVTVFVITTGNNPNYDDCINALKVQDCTFTLDIIKDYSPMARAFQEMINRCTTPYYIQVDEDMVLEPDCVRKMYEFIGTTESTHNMAVFWLRDPHLDMDICGIKIYKNEILKRYPYDLNNMSCEVDQIDRMSRDGYSYKDAVVVVGQHAPKWTFEGIFERYYNLAMKWRKFKYTWMEQLGIKIAESIKRDPSHINIAALLGWQAGLTIPVLPDKEKDFRISISNKKIEE